MRDAEGPFFLVHRLMQDVTQRSLSDDLRQRRLIEALNWVNAAFPLNADDVRYWPLAEALVPHALAVTEHAATVTIPSPNARLMTSLDCSLCQRLCTLMRSPSFGGRWRS
jgi:hypothetical protein